MEFLKSIFGEEALTFAQLSEKLKDSKEIKLANLASGQYVDKAKLDDKITELGTANTTIKNLQDAVKKFDGVDVDGLRTSLETLQTKYDGDLAAAKLDSALGLALVTAKAKNPKLAKAALDLSAVKLDGDKLLGLDDQITKLKETDAYLFEIDAPGGAHVDSGAGHGSGGGADYSKMSDAEYYAATMKKKE